MWSAARGAPGRFSDAAASACSSRSRFCAQKVAKCRRRRADARWRIRSGDVDELADLQQRILLASAPLVKPGGSLVYSVCTLTKAESVDVVAGTAGALATLGFRADLPAEDDWESYGPDTLVVVPGAANDGMALARWRRA